MRRTCDVCAKPFEAQDTILAIQFFFCEECGWVTYAPRTVGSAFCVHCGSREVIRVKKTSELADAVAEFKLPFPCPDCAVQLTNPFFMIDYLVGHGFLIQACVGCGAARLYHPGSPEAQKFKAERPGVWDGEKFREHFAYTCEDCEELMMNQDEPEIPANQSTRIMLH